MTGGSGSSGTIGASARPAQAIDGEAASFLASHADLIDQSVRRRLVCNGFSALSA
jgi:hypothetical protein